MAWTMPSSARERTFESWEAHAMQCLRSGSSDFALIIALRKSIRSDGLVLATNAELRCAAGCSAKSLKIDLSKLRASGLIISTFQSLKGFSGRRRVIRLSKPPTDDGG
jgi:hypothetical protein